MVLAFGSTQMKVAVLAALMCVASVPAAAQDYTYNGPHYPEQPPSEEALLQVCRAAYSPQALSSTGTMTEQQSYAFAQGQLLITLRQQGMTEKDLPMVDVICRFYLTGVNDANKETVAMFDSIQQATQAEQAALAPSGG
jgi:hypothetical protein